ncbi:MAG: hypothetical protein ABI851_02075 [Saprospiraceae bacterium]
MRNLSTIILLLTTSLLFAEVKVEIKPSDQGQCSGEIKITATAGVYPNYNISVIGLSPLIYQEYRYNINGVVTLSNICAGEYQIRIWNVTGSCDWKFNKTIEGCNNSLSIIADIKGDCKSKNYNSLGSILLNISGGNPPYLFTWKDSKGNLVSTQNPVLGLKSGDYSVMIKDNNECTTNETYKVLKSDVTIFNWFLTPVCYNISDYKVEMNDKLTQFDFFWNEDLSHSKSKSVHKKTLDSKISENWNLTITDQAARCWSTVGVEINKAIVSFEIIEAIHATTDNSYDGELKIHFDNLFNGPAKIEYLRDGDPPPTKKSTQQILANRTFELKGLKAGHYTIKIYDKSYCYVGEVDAIVYSCSQIPINPIIVIDNYALPPSYQYAYAKATASYKGDYYPNGETNKCFYKWYINDYYKLTTKQPEISSSELKKLVTNFNNPKLCVTMYCPCGNATNCVEYNPCDGDNTLKIITKTNEILCYGELPPNGKKIENKTSAELYLKLDLSNLLQGNSGDILYGKKINKIEWSDGGNSINSYSNNILIIRRNVLTAGKYVLSILTADGCIREVIFDVKNEFSIDEINSEFCFYWVKCGNTYMNDGHPYREGRLIPNLSTTSDKCDFLFYCGTTKTKDVFSFKQLTSELIEEDGKCFYIDKCVLELDVNALDPLIYPNFTIQNIQVSNEQPHPSIIFSDKRQGECCLTANTTTSEISVNLKHIDQDYTSKNNLTITPADISDGANPCIATYYCNGYFQKIIGQKTGTPNLCKLGNTEPPVCYITYDCNFVINGNNFTSTNVTNSPLQARFRYEGNNCTNNLPQCNFVAYQDTSVSRTKAISNNSIVLIPNPFEQLIEIKYSLDSKLNKYFDFSLWNSQGIKIHQNKFDVDSNFGSKFINLNELPIGIYFYKIKLEKEDTFTGRLVKIN